MEDNIYFEIKSAADWHRHLHYLKKLGYRWWNGLDIDIMANTFPSGKVYLHVSMEHNTHSVYWNKEALPGYKLATLEQLQNMSKSFPKYAAIEYNCPEMYDIIMRILEDKEFISSGGNNPTEIHQSYSKDSGYILMTLQDRGRHICAVSKKGIEDSKYEKVTMEKLFDIPKQIILNGYTVQFLPGGSINVGCVKVSWEHLEELYNRAKQLRT